MPQEDDRSSPITLMDPVTAQWEFFEKELPLVK